MIVRRWQAALLPTIDQIKMIFQSEGLSPMEEIYEPLSLIKEHRHPFDEVRMIVKGEIIYNVAGNQLLLRSGDRIEIPSNTRHETKVSGDEPCVSIYSFKPF